MAGLHRKYEVSRTDGRSVEGQEFFVLRVDPGSKDQAAITALEAYREALPTDDQLRGDLARTTEAWAQAKLRALTPAETHPGGSDAR